LDSDRHGKTTFPVFSKVSKEIRELFFHFVLGAFDSLPIIGCRVEEEEEHQSEEVEEDEWVNADGAK
jgi:hypothetical protein